LAGRLYFVKNNFKISGVVVPHHNLVAGLRAEFFENLAKNISAPKTIILLSPNHYNAGQGNIQTSDKNWNLNQGQINADKKVVSFLVENNLTVNESPSFVEEHGIYNILSDIHNNFPNAKLVPIIFENASADQINKLEQGLKNSCAKCLMIASVDFSHDQPIAVAQINDGQSITDLQKLDSAGLLENAKVDSPPALALLAMWAKDHNTLNFILKNHIGSGANLQNPGIESVTHVFGWYENK
jgi:AmmeMemoRadiSam system protein B